MRLHLLIAVSALTLATSVSGPARSGSLEGCIDPNSIITAMAKLHESDWRDLSLERLRSIWPAEIDGKDCDPGGCRDVWSEDRIISGHCQCCATFSFRIQGKETSPRTRWLDNVVINYSSKDRGELVIVAKKLAAAFGLGKAELETVGTESAQNFHWATTGKSGRELSAVELRFTRDGDRWKLYLNCGQNITE